MMIPICIDKNNENHHEVTMIMTIMMIGRIGIRKKNNNNDTDNNDVHR